MKIISLDTEKPQDSRRKPISKCPAVPSSTPVPAPPTPGRAAFSASLPVSITSVQVDALHKKAQGRAKKSLFEGVVPDAFPAEFEQYEETFLETAQTEERTGNCVLFARARSDQLQGTCRRVQSALQPASIWDSHHAKGFFIGSHVKFMCKMTRFMGS